MLHTELLGQLRTIVRAKLINLGCGSEPIGETILLRSDTYVGRRFDSAGWRIIWLADGGSLELYDEESRLVESWVFEPSRQDGQRAA